MLHAYFTPIGITFPRGREQECEIRMNLSLLLLGKAFICGGWGEGEGERIEV